MNAVNKTLRIMIAHEHHAHRVTVEKYLNCIGYYCVAPVCSLTEMVILTRPPVKPFDLLIISRELYMTGESCSFFHGEGAPNIYQILLYENRRFLTRDELLDNTETPRKTDHSISLQAVVL